MASIKIIHRLDKEKNGVAPLYVRVTQHRRTRFLSTGVSLKANLWNSVEGKVKKSHPNSMRINALLASKISDAERTVLELSTAGKTVSASMIKERLKGKPSGCFLAFSKKYTQRIASKNVGTYKRVLTVLQKLREYHGNDTLLFTDLTVSFLKDYDSYLREKKKNHPNTIHANFRVIRKILNDAVSEDLMPMSENPFIRFKMKLVKSERDYLTEEEIDKLKNLTLNKNAPINHYRNMFLLSCETGLRISDMLTLRWKHFDGEKLNILTRKTSTVISIKVPNNGLRLLEEYRPKVFEPAAFVFPVIRIQGNQDARSMHSAISSATTTVNNNLKVLATKAGIEKRLSFHISRHTFATRALRKGMRIEYVSKLMGHADIKETQIYAKIVNEELDKAMDVFNI
jgi:integrase/recombinase XerD